MECIIDGERDKLVAVCKDGTLYRHCPVADTPRGAVSVSMALVMLVR